MRFKVELHPEVIDFVRHRCKENERVEFFAVCDRIAENPIKHSEPTTDPKLSRYPLRFARFGDYIAIFDFDRSRQWIRVRQCRRLRKPEKTPNDARRAGDDPPHDKKCRR